MGFLKDKGRRNILSVIICIILAIIMFKFGMPQSERKIKKRYIQSSKNEKFHGIIKKMYVEKYSHNRAFVELNNQSSRINLTNKLYESLNINDSIVKKENELFIVVFRDKNIIRLDYFNGEVIKR